MESNESQAESAATTEENKTETVAPVLSQEEILKADVEEQKKKYLYLYAEFENFKKRAIRERSDLVKFGNESLVREILTVVDNFERALAHAGDENKDALVTGIKMVGQQFKDTLGKFGVQTILAVGQKFDPEKHEAVSQEVTEEKETGIVVREHQKGYTLHGRLLRPAKVVVSISSAAVN